MTRRSTKPSVSPRVLVRDQASQQALAVQAAIDKLGVKYSGVAIDSRKVRPGDLFLAYSGDAADGRHFIPQALAAGAVIVLWEASAFEWNPDWNVPNIAVEGLRYHAGYIAEHFFKHPSRHLWVTGVTGTNGKTTCTQWIAQSLNRLQRKCAVVGTLGRGLIDADISGQVARNTTPDPVTLHAFLGEMRAKGAQAVAMEVSSHGIDQGRG